MEELKKALKQTPIIYITRDLERALGLSPNYPGYYIVANLSDYAKRLVKGRANMLLIKEDRRLDTRELLEHPLVIKFIAKFKNPRLLVFKNTTQIERICKEKGWTLLNPPADLAARVEDKISQLEWLGPLASLLPPHRLDICRNLVWERKKYVVQFNRSHTGGGTILIENKNQIKELIKKFPLREVRVTDYVVGPVFTNNNIVWGRRVLTGNINYQITGLSPFTDRRFATIGNDWALPRRLLAAAQRKEFQAIAKAVGRKLISSGWRGLYGIDAVWDAKKNKFFLIEVNARQPASTAYESQLQTEACPGEHCLTSFKAHLLSLLRIKSPNFKLTKIMDGAQVIQRVLASEPASLAKSTHWPRGVSFLAYDNVKPGEDLLRLHSKTGLMEKPGEFNALGKQIIRALQGIKI